MRPRASASVVAGERGRAITPWLWIAVRALALGAAYAGLYALVTVGTSFGTTLGATLWPSSGVTLATLICRPQREWPLYLIAIAVADFTMDVVAAGFPTRVSYGLAVANLLEPLLSAILLRRWLRGRPDLSRLRDLELFFLTALAGGPVLSAVVGSSWRWLLGGGAIWPFLGRWYVGDLLGVVVIAPLLLDLSWPVRRPAVKLSQAGMFALLLAVTAVALPWRFAAAIGLPFLIIPALSWIGIRMGTRAAAVGVFIVGAIVETLTALARGPFSGGGPFTGLLSAQMYLAACSAAGLSAAALMAGLVSRDELARHDSLTGLANRRALIDQMATACNAQSRDAGQIGLVFIDLDGFKRVNDEHGHAFGDRVLIETARRLQSVVRGVDTVARFGGDEFVILIDGVTQPGDAARAHPSD